MFEQIFKYDLNINGKKLLLCCIKPWVVKRVRKKKKKKEKEKEKEKERVTN